MPILRLRGRNNVSGLWVTCLLSNGLVPPSEVVVAPSVSTSLVLVIFSSDDVIGVTLFTKGRLIDGIAGNGGGCKPDIRLDKIG